MKNILALDLGSRLGFAAFFEERVESGVVEFKVERGESIGMRFVRFNRWLAEILSVVQPQLVLYELPHLRGGFATDVLVGMSTRVMEACARHEIEYVSVHTGTLKKYAISGKATKQEMAEKARIRFGNHLKDDNEIDAMWLLAYGRERYEPSL